MVDEVPRTTLEQLLLQWGRSDVKAERCKAQATVNKIAGQQSLDRQADYLMETLHNSKLRASADDRKNITQLIRGLAQAKRLYEINYEIVNRIKNDKSGLSNDDKKRYYPIARAKLLLAKSKFAGLRKKAYGLLEQYPIKLTDHPTKEENDWWKAVAAITRRDIMQQQDSKDQSASNVLATTDILKRPIAFVPTKNNKPPTEEELANNFSRNMADYLFLGDKEGGANRPGKFGGQYLCCYMTQKTDGSFDVNVHRSVIKQDTKDKKIRYSHVIAEKFASDLAIAMMPRSGASVFYARAPWEAKGTSANQADPTGENVYDVSVYFNNYDDLYKDLYAEEHREDFEAFYNTVSDFVDDANKLAALNKLADELSIYESKFKGKGDALHGYIAKLISICHGDQETKEQQQVEVFSIIQNIYQTVHAVRKVQPCPDAITKAIGEVEEFLDDITFWKLKEQHERLNDEPVEDRPKFLGTPAVGFSGGNAAKRFNEVFDTYIVKKNPNPNDSKACAYEDYSPTTIFSAFIGDFDAHTGNYGVVDQEYDLALLLRNPGENLPNDLCEDTQKNNRPILIKRGDQFSIYGYRQREWKETKLNLSSEELQVLNKLSFTKNIEILPKEEIDKALLQILKKGHNQKRLVRIDFGAALSREGFFMGATGGNAIPDEIDIHSLTKHPIGAGPTNHIVEFPRDFRANLDFAKKLDEQSNFPKEKLFATIVKSMTETSEQYGTKPFIEFAQYVGVNVGAIRKQNNNFSDNDIGSFKEPAFKASLVKETIGYLQRKMHARQAALKYLAVEVRMSAYTERKKNGEWFEFTDDAQKNLKELIKDNPSYFMRGDFHFRANEQILFKISLPLLGIDWNKKKPLLGVAMDKYAEAVLREHDGIDPIMRKDFKLIHKELRAEALAARLEILASYVSDPEHRKVLIELAENLKLAVKNYMVDRWGSKESSTEAKVLVSYSDDAYRRVRKAYKELTLSNANPKLVEQMSVGATDSIDAIFDPRSAEAAYVAKLKREAGIARNAMQPVNATPAPEVMAPLSLPEAAPALAASPPVAAPAIAAPAALPAVAAATPLPPSPVSPASVAPRATIIKAEDYGLPVGYVKQKSPSIVANAQSSQAVDSFVASFATLLVLLGEMQKLTGATDTATTALQTLGIYKSLPPDVPEPQLNMGPPGIQVK